jgi:valyl-tRNA synthetase
LNRVVFSAIQLMQDYQFGEAQRQIYDFLWSEFCDWYIEIAKIRLRNQESISPIPVLIYNLETALRLLHPYMPFITEELWQTLNSRIEAKKERPESIMIAAYPTPQEKAFDEEAESIMSTVIDIVHCIRNVRAEHQVESNKWIEARIYAGDREASLRSYLPTIQALAQVRPLELVEAHHGGTSDDNDLVTVLKNCEVVIPLASMVDTEAEKSRLQKELGETRTNVDRLEVRLNDTAFTSKAPAAVVQKERERLAQARDKLQRLEQQLQRFT